MPALPAIAQITHADLLVAGRALGFINNLKPGDVRVGIVYDPTKAESAQQATEFSAAMAGGMRVGTLILKPVMLPIANLSGAHVEVFLLTAGMGAEATQVGRASQTRKIPCITFDMRQVRNAVCAMGVRSQPKIEVIVNRSAAQACAMDLAAVFRMMIKEI